MTPTAERPAPAASLSELAGEVASRLREGLAVRRTLPGNGRIHIDRPLPFLLVYRRPLDREDPQMEELVKSEASYLFVAAEPRFRKGLRRLVGAVAEAMREAFGDFLVVEVFSRPPAHPPLVPESGPRVIPAFRIAGSPPHPDAYPLLERLESQLRRIKIAHSTAQVAVLADPKKWTAWPKPLLSKKEGEALRCVQLAVEVEPIFRSAEGAEFPRVLRRLRSRFGRSLRRLFFLFAERFTTHRPPNFHALGRRAVVKAVWEVDAKLDRISKSFDFLLNVSPINTPAAWQEFRRSGFEKVPRLYYRPLPIDPVLTKRALYSVPIEKIEDPTLAQMFLEKQAELDRQITMLDRRDSRGFLLESIQLYGWVDDQLLRAAESILERVPERPGAAGRRTIKSQAFKRLAEAEIEHYKRIWDGFDARVAIDETVSSLIVSRGRLLIPDQFETTEFRASALLHHEVGTHLVTYYNGGAHRLTQLRSGLAGYEELQEGLATFCEYLAGGMSATRLRILAARVVTARMAIERTGFVDSFRLLCRYGFTQRSAFNITVRLYRSGGLTKDMVYLRGLMSVLAYVREGNDLEPLLVGKIAIKHVPVVRELQTRGVLSDVPLRPRILDTDECRERLAKVREGIEVHELVAR